MIDATRERPLNLLFITADQWRADCLSGAGHPIVRTPHLDALARDGVSFRAHYCQALPCGPSRASLYTGLYLMNHRSTTNGTPLDRRHTNFAQLLRRAGYDPTLFGYTDTSVDPRDCEPDDPRLRTYEGILPGLSLGVHVNTEDVAAWADWLAGLGYDIPDPPTALLRRKADGVEWEDGGAVPLPLALDPAHSDTHFVTDRALDWIRAQGVRPWCVHLSLLRPHPPFVAPAPYNARYPPRDLPAPIRALTRDDEAAQHPYLARQVLHSANRSPRRDDTLRRVQASYYGLMSEVDDQLGRLFDALRALGVWERTLVVFTSDHGEQMGEHWLLGKCGYFDASYRVPLVVRDPRPHADATRGRSVGRFTEHVDVLPTLLEAIGHDAPPACDGRSLVPFLREAGEPRDWRTEAHWEYDFRNPNDATEEDALGLPMHACNLAVLRGSRFKYVHFAGLPPLLFDLAEDPHEFVDRARDPGYQHVLLDCAQRMLDWRMRHADQTLTHMKLTKHGVVTRPAPRW
jgi:arylsulfatase A-like enzyme